VMSVQDEISNMLNTFEGSRDTSTEAEEPKEEVVEEPVEEKPLAEESVEEPVELEEPIVDEPVDSENPVEPVEPEEDKDSIINELRNRINELEGTKPTEPEPEPEVKVDPDAKYKPITVDPQDFVGELDLDDIYNDKEEFNSLLNKVYIEGVNSARKTVVEEVLRAIPDIVRTNINVMSELKQTSEQFYKDNPDLSPFKKVVAVVFEDIAAQNPDKPYTEMLGKVAAETRKRLELQQKAVNKKPENRKVPKLPSKTGGPRPADQKPNTSGIEDDIAEMNKVIGGNR